MQPMTIKAVLTGPLAGRTMTLNRHQFVKGVATIVGQPDELNAALTYLGRSYQAYPEGSPALQAAQKRFEDSKKGKSDGLQRPISNAATLANGAPDAIQSAFHNEAGKVSGTREVSGNGHAQGDAGSPGLVPGGPGHEDAGLGEGMGSPEERESRALMAEIQNAIRKLDPTQDLHWTPDGAPSLDVVAEAVGQPALTRADLDMVLPGWNRRKAADVAGEVASL